MNKQLFLVLIGIATLVNAANYTYRVELYSLPSVPVVSDVDGSSTFAQSFNPTWIPSHNGNAAGLLVRSQNCSAVPGGRCTYCSGEGQFASVLSFAQLLTGDDTRVTFPRFSKLTRSSIVYEYQGDVREIYGTEDPRITYDPATSLYYMFYTCYGRQPTSPDNSILLCLATAKDPTKPGDYGGWQRHGPVFPAIQNSKSAALVLPQVKGDPYTLIWGAGSIHVAKSYDPTRWPVDGGVPFLNTRSDWESKGVESGPPPLKLSTGDLFFIYNAWDMNVLYNPGFLILDKTDPSIILQRSDAPFMSPVHSWDRGTYPYTCNVPNVVFVEAAHETDVPDVFRIYFGAADAAIGTALIRVIATPQ